MVENRYKCRNWWELRKDENGSSDFHCYELTSSASVGQVTSAYSLPHVTNEIQPFGVTTDMINSFYQASVTFDSPTDQKVTFRHSLSKEPFKGLKQDDIMFFDYDFSFDVFGQNNKVARIASYTLVIDNSVWQTLAGPYITQNDNVQMGVYTRQAYVILKSLAARAINNLPTVRISLNLNFPTYETGELSILFGVVASRYVADFTTLQEEDVPDLSLLFDEDENDDYVIV